MSKTITKTSLRGFTLIELLVVIAIIGLLSTAIMGPVQTGLKKGRDTRKISDLTQIQGALLQYAGDNNGKYPDYLVAPDGSADTITYLASTTPTYMIPDAKMLGGTSIAGLKVPAARDRYMYVNYKDGADFIVSYHLGVALENQNASLQGDADCGNGPSGGAVGSGTTIKCGAGVSSAAKIRNANYFENGAGNPKATDVTVDFGGKGTMEDVNQVCSASLITCIFDITPN